MLDSVSRANEKYYPQTLLEECKYEIKRNKVTDHCHYTGKYIEELLLVFVM